MSRGRRHILPNHVNSWCYLSWLFVFRFPEFVLFFPFLNAIFSRLYHVEWRFLDEVLQRNYLAIDGGNGPRKFLVLFILVICFLISRVCSFFPILKRDILKIISCGVEIFG